MGSQESKFTSPSNRNLSSVLSKLHNTNLKWFHFSSQCRANGWNWREVCKVTKIQHVKLKGTFERQHALEGVIVETDIGLDGQPVPLSSATSTGGGEQILIIRTRGASTRILEEVTEDSETQEIARWIKDLICDGPNPTPHWGDHRLGDTDVQVPEVEWKTGCYTPPFAYDGVITITKANISTSHYDVLNEFEVPPQLDIFSDTGLTFYKLLLIAQCVARQDAVYSVFRRQDSWFARLIWGAAHNMFGQSVMSDSSEGVEASATGSLEKGGEGRTDFIRISSPTSKSDDLGPYPVSSGGVGDSVWKRIFISKIEERLVQEVVEQFHVRWEEDMRQLEEQLAKTDSLGCSRRTAELKDHDHDRFRNGRLSHQDPVLSATTNSATHHTIARRFANVPHFRHSRHPPSRLWTGIIPLLWRWALKRL